MLVKAGQDPEAEDSYGQTPLHLAALRGNLDAAEYLVMEVRYYWPAGTSPPHMVHVHGQRKVPKGTTCVVRFHWAVVASH